MKCSFCIILLLIQGNGSDSLMEALLDALQYVEERNDDEQHMQMQQQQPPSAQKSTSSSKKQTVAAKSTPKTPVQPKEILNNSGKVKKTTPIAEVLPHLFLYMFILPIIYSAAVPESHQQ
jgi:hypothetical protein